MKGFGTSIFARVTSLMLVACMMAVTFGASANARFISPDDWDPTKPGVGTNRYAYAGNDPINNSDPNGHIFGIDDAIGFGIAMGLATLGAWLGSSSPANAPGPNDKIQTKSDSEVARDMALGACMAACGSAAVRGGLSALSKTKNEDKKEVASTEEKLNNSSTDINIESKIEKQMQKRGWTEKDIKETISNPDKTVKTTDSRFDPTTNTRRADPATAYVNKDGSYVVRNDTNGSVVQVSNKNDPNWQSPF